MSKDIADVLRIESNVTTSFYALSCLQKDFKYVMHKCASIDKLSAKLDSMQTSIDKRQVRQLIYSDDGDGDDDEYDDNASNETIADTTTDDDDDHSCDHSSDPEEPLLQLNDFC